MLLILSLLLLIIFMQGIYIYIPEKTMFTGYAVLQLFCSYNLCCMHTIWCLLDRASLW